MLKILIFLFLLIPNPILSQSHPYVLVGCTGQTYSTFMVWVPFLCDIDVKVKSKQDTSWFESKKITGACSSNKLEFVQLLPGTEYEYLVTTTLGDTMMGKFRTFNKIEKNVLPPNIRISAGSCSWTQKGKNDSDLVVFNSILSTDPDLMLWLGDNVYLVDGEWQNASSIEMRYSQFRNIQQVKNLIGQVPNLSVWDDHDFGPNDGVGSFTGVKISGEIFSKMWSNPPSYVNGNPNLRAFSHSMGDISIFGIDNRTQRTLPNSKNPQMLSRLQIDWLVENLKFHKKSTYKIIMCGSQILNDQKVYENFSNFPKERRYLLSQIIKNKIEGVIFLTGDRHHSEISVYKKRGIKIWDVTTSPLTSKVSSVSGEKNKLRIPGSLHRKKGFATLDFSGDISSRECLVVLRNSKGEGYYKYKMNYTLAKD